MPELAEVEYYRRQWDAGVGGAITAVEMHAAKRVFRDLKPHRLGAALRGARLESSQAHGKQMLFAFSGGAWMGLHLGMTGALRVESTTFIAGKHDHLVLRQSKRALVFADPRCFGSVRLHCGAKAPRWWTALPPAVLSAGFTFERMSAFLARHARAPIKANLLDQEGFPGVGNWMADEILWRARLHPGARTHSLRERELKSLWREVQSVCRGAMRYVAQDYVAKEFGDPPATWLFSHRWQPDGRCPRDGHILRRATIGGRTTAWCQDCQG